MGPVDSLSPEHNLPDLSGCWAVLRHGGRSVDSWRVRYRGQQEEAARDAFKKCAIRQGGLRLRLYAPDGRLVESQWAPRLRTRW